MEKLVIVVSVAQLVVNKQITLLRKVKKIFCFF